MKSASYDKNENRYKLIKKRIDQNKIRYKQRKEIDVNFNIISKIDYTQFKPHVRSGAIVYTHHKGKTYFCLGIDSEYGDLTDFGGGVKKDENIIEGGLRELEEESQGIFGKFIYNHVKDSLAVYSNNMLIMFIKSDINMDESKMVFNNRIMDKINKNPETNLEVSNILWLSCDEFIECIEGFGLRIYVRVSKMLDKIKENIKSL